VREPLVPVSPRTAAMIDTAMTHAGLA
jgi:hypothetical protein